MMNQLLEDRFEEAIPVEIKLHLDDLFRSILKDKAKIQSDLRHFSHREHRLFNFVERYSLSGFEMLEYGRVKCAICTLNIRHFPFWACPTCGFFLHKECAELPETLRSNPLHTKHTLTLKPIPSHDIYCYACHLKQSFGFVYRCNTSACDVNFDSECALIDKQVLLTHFSSSIHEHPLELFKNVPKGRFHCRLCGEYCSDLTYGCFPCRLFLHRSCYERNLPGKIPHFFHACPLALSTYNPDFSDFWSCRACYKPLSPGLFYYGCRECPFGMHVDCTLLATKGSSTSTEEQNRYHFLHGHPLSLCVIKDDDTWVINCYACRARCTNPTYACLQPSCSKKVYICKTCIELPKEICHPFHPYHPLTLLQQYHGDHLQHIDWKAPLPGSVCNACRRETGIVVYSCQSENCSFRLHVGCSGIRGRAIEYEAHDHLLQFKENIDGQLNCSACNSTCNSYAFSCLHCDNFNLHHTCGPLPSTIKHECHIHRLILSHSLAVYEDERDNEFYCDACEEARDPQLPIYQCTECQFAAEVKCVISEVISSLNGEYEKVELKNFLGQFGKVITKDAAKEMMKNKEKQLKSTLTWNFFLSTFSEDEKKEVRLLKDKIKETTNAKEIKPYDHEEIIMFSDKAYTQFMEFLNHSKVSQNRFPYDWDIGSHDLNQELVHVKGYTTSRKLAPILDHLLSNHGDIGAESTLSPQVKSLYFCFLCECIDRMRNTKVVDVTDDILLGWWRCLKILQSAGFKIEFAFDRLKIVTDAHFGLYAEKQVDNTLHQLDRDIEKLTRKRERIKSAKSAKFSLNIEKCLREASLLGKSTIARRCI